MTMAPGPWGKSSAGRRCQVIDTDALYGPLAHRSGWDDPNVVLAARIAPRARQGHWRANCHKAVTCGRHPGHVGILFRSHSGETPEKLRNHSEDQLAQIDIAMTPPGSPAR